MTATLTTAQAATHYGVSLSTIYRRIHRGIITATKIGRRWAITIEETTMTHDITETRRALPNGRMSTSYSVGPIGETRAALRTSYATEELARTHLAIAQAVGGGFRVTRESHPARSIRTGTYWRIVSTIAGDPARLDISIDEATSERIATVGRQARQHAAGADARIAAHAEAEPARQEQLAQIAADRGPLATPRQVDYIMQLLHARTRSGDAGGFFSGPTTRDGVQELTRTQASTYIDSLTNNY
jgi:excisionase family DNA binding protein